MTPEPVLPVPHEATAHRKEYSGLIYNLEAQLAKVLRLAMFVTSLGLGLLMAAQVFMRYVIQSPFLGIEELAPMLALWVYFLGMAYSSRERDHISGGVLALITHNPKILMVIRLLGTFLCLVAVVVFGYYAWKLTAFNLKLNRASVYMRWPKYLWDFSMMAGFILMGFYYLLQLTVEFRALVAMKGK
ncbi:TRAP transporter small permease [Pseudovibrio brasiliensis]|uniref:TRAP transporter small permease protein n=2 Tax=Pseudovibrio brasiliensis TaxID=1898042 RepID=A0ABX8AUJ8_9HYPH|nr:TRAP transporter small permease [Pseudovibrio brasiliensis]